MHGSSLDHTWEYGPKNNIFDIFIIIVIVHPKEQRHAKFQEHIIFAGRDTRNDRVLICIYIIEYFFWFEFKLKKKHGFEEEFSFCSYSYVYIQLWSSNVSLAQKFYLWSNTKEYVTKLSSSNGWHGIWKEYKRPKWRQEIGVCSNFCWVAIALWRLIIIIHWINYWIPSRDGVACKKTSNPPTKILEIRTRHSP